MNINSKLIQLFNQNTDLNEETTVDFISTLSNPTTEEDDLIKLTLAWKNKGESPKELALIAKHILSIIDTVKVDFPVADCCGTGGDNSGTYNISTTSAFLAAASGIKMAKHGGRKTTSSSGSIDFLEALGIKTFSEPREIKEQIENKGLVFIASPATQKLLGSWKGICRKLELFGQTGLIGTLTNPVNLSHQVLGVPKPEWGPLMLEALKILGRKNALVVHGQPQMDEGSLCGKTQIWKLQNNKTEYLEIEPKALGIEKNYELTELLGGSPEDNAKIFNQLIEAKSSKAILDTVCFNTALILWLFNESSSLTKVFDQTKDIIQSHNLKKFYESMSSFPHS